MDLINICASYITSNEEFLFIAFVCLTFVTLIRILTTTPVVPTLASETQLLLKLNMECNLLKEYNLLKEGQYHDPEIHASPIDVNNTANNRASRFFLHKNKKEETLFINNHNFI